MFKSSKETPKVNTFFDVHETLRKFFLEPIMYPDFPKIPIDICDAQWLLKKDFSIYKKWTAFYVINDGKSEYRETLEVIPEFNIVFHFNEEELNVEHYGKRIRSSMSEIVDVSLEVQQYEEALKTVLVKWMFDFFSDDISIKLKHLKWHWLEGISLFFRDGRYIVIDSEIVFSQWELEQIKRAVFI